MSGGQRSGSTSGLELTVKAAQCLKLHNYIPSRKITYQVSGNFNVNNLTHCHGNSWVLKVITVLPLVAVTMQFF